MQTTFPGGWIVRAKLGQGNSPVFDVCRDGQRAACKVVQIDSETSRARLAIEVSAMAELKHPNIVELYECHYEGDKAYIFMELVEGGQTLAEFVGSTSARNEEFVRSLLLQAVSALTALHAVKLVHRDLKPENIVIGPTGIVKLIDFGIAKNLEHVQNLTRTGLFIGTPKYASPEACLGDREVGPPADVYSLGLVAYELIAGHPAFSRETAVQYLHAHCREMPPHLKKVTPTMGSRFNGLVMEMISKEPTDRPSASEIHRQLLQMQRKPARSGRSKTTTTSRSLERGRSAENETIEQARPSPRKALCLFIYCILFAFGWGAAIEAFVLSRNPGNRPDAADCLRLAIGLPFMAVVAPQKPPSPPPARDSPTIVDTSLQRDLEVPRPSSSAQQNVAGEQRIATQPFVQLQLKAGTLTRLADNVFFCVCRQPNGHVRGIEGQLHAQRNLYAVHFASGTPQEQDCDFGGIRRRLD